MRTFQKALVIVLVFLVSCTGTDQGTSSPTVGNIPTTLPTAMVPAATEIPTAQADGLPEDGQMTVNFTVEVPANLYVDDNGNVGVTIQGTDTPCVSLEEAFFAAVTSQTVLDSFVTEPVQVRALECMRLRYQVHVGGIPGASVTALQRGNHEKQENAILQIGADLTECNTGIVTLNLPVYQPLDPSIWEKVVSFVGDESIAVNTIELGRISFALEQARNHTLALDTIRVDLYQQWVNCRCAQLYSSQGEIDQCKADNPANPLALPDTSSN